jgi:origin recognition complex subunit 6
VTWPAGEGDVDRDKYIAFRKEVAACLAKARTEVAVPKGKSGKDEVAEEEWWEGWTDAGPRDLDAAAVRGGRHGWFEMNWAEGVDDLVARQRRAEGGSEDAGGVDNGQEAEGIRRLEAEHVKAHQGTRGTVTAIITT